MAARLALDVRLEQFAVPIGVLAAFDDGAVRFEYAPAYVTSPSALPLSLALPLQAEPFDDFETRTFFQNLLPENNQLDEVIARERLPRDDVAGLLYHLGADCPGAISCLPRGRPPAKTPGQLAVDYQVIAPEQLEEIVRRLAFQEPLDDIVRDPSPVAGVQRKVAIVALPDGRFAFPRPASGVPTTHILKVPYRTRPREARLEAEAAALAEACGLNVVRSEARRFGEHEALLIPRFDRRITADGHVLRIHQEDFAQALALPPGRKYQRPGDRGRQFSAAEVAVLLDRTAEPARARRDFLAATVFNMLTGNVDNHAKNHALLYDIGRAPRVAPLYDLLPTRLDRSFTSDFAFRIGAAERLEDLTVEDFALFLNTFGLSVAAARRFLTDQLGPMIERLEVAAQALPRSLKDFDDLIGRETEHLVEVLELGLEIRERDYVPPHVAG